MVEDYPGAAQNDEAAKVTDGHASGAESTSPTPSVVALPPGDALTPQEASRLTIARRCQLIVIAGPADSGKTTLITTLFHLFQKGSYAGYLFAGSETLVGFDKRCHLARITSGGDRADTDRTIPGESRHLLHLRLRQESLESLKDILISDVSGEEFREAKNSIDECRRLPLLRRADHFVLLIDGHKLAQLASRHGVRSDAMMLLQCCLDAGQLGSMSFVDVLFSKWDLVEQSDSTDTAEFASAIEQNIAQRFGQRFARIRFARIAARPDTNALPLGHGLDAVFPSWVEQRSPVQSDLPALEFSDLATEFDRFLLRRIPYSKLQVQE